MEDSAKACRICRGDEEPLFYPCKCTGSIRYVHQDCLMEWLRHVGSKTKCELCGYEYQFKNIYSPDIPDELPVKVYLYKLWSSSRAAIAKLSLLGRAIFMICVTSVVINYVLELYTIYGDAFIDTLNFDYAVRTFIRRHRSPRLPHIQLLQVTFSSRALQECWTAVMDGLALLVLTTAITLLVWMVSVWTLQDAVLQHELHHLIAEGVDFSVEQERDNLRQQVGPVDLRGLDEQVRDQVVQLQDLDGMPLNAAAMARPDDDAFDDGEDLWNLFEGLFGSPMRYFLVFLAVTVVMLYVVYLIPYCAGRLLLFEFTYIGKFYRWLPLDWEEPKTIEVRLLTFAAGCSFFVFTLATTYFLLFKWLRASPTGRNYLAYSKQILSITKVLIIVLVEAVIFPYFCGVLFTISVLPLFKNNSLSNAVSTIQQRPWFYSFIQWAVGMLYMLELADFLKTCRKFLRRGVLYFVQDPNDPANEPIRNILNYSLWTHFKKISVSGLIYTVLIVGCIGGVCGLLRLVGVVPYVVAPLDLSSLPNKDVIALWPFVLYALLHARDSRPPEMNDSVEVTFKKEFERAAAALDLGSFLFDWRKDPRDDEPGYFVRAPSVDSFTTKWGLKLFIPVDIMDKRLDGKEDGPQDLKRYKIVWRPRFFWLRVIGLLLWIWLVAICLVSFCVLVPLLTGRTFNKLAFSSPIENDIILYIVGCIILFSAIGAAENLRPVLRDASTYRAMACCYLRGRMIEYYCSTIGSVFPKMVQRVLLPADNPYITSLMYGILSADIFGTTNLELFFAYVLMTEASRFAPEWMYPMLPIGLAVQILVLSLLFSDHKGQLAARWHNFQLEAKDEYYIIGKSLKDYSPQATS